MDGTQTGSPGMSAVMTLVVWSGFLLLVVGCLGVGYAQKRLSQGPTTFTSEPVELLRRRLASGKIDDEEYVRRRFELQSR
jgi:uncharacterized membrane protein